MFKSNKFGRIFWVDDELEFKSCPLNVDGTGDFNCEDYVSEWDDFSDVDINELLAIHKVCILNKTQYAGSLSLNDYAHKITNSDEPVIINLPEGTNLKKRSMQYDCADKVTDRKDIVVDTFTNDYADKVDTLVDNMKMNSYKWDEQFYNEIVKNDKFSYGKFNDIDYPIHLSQS